MNKKIFSVLLLVAVIGSVMAVSASEMGEFTLGNITINAPADCVFQGVTINHASDDTSTSFSFNFFGSDDDNKQQTNSSSTNITYQGYVDSVNQISVDDVSGVDGDPKQLMPSDWKETDSSGNLTVFKNPDFDKDDLKDDDGDIDADDLKYGVVLDNGAHKIIVKGNDLNLIKTIANSVKSC